jgi:uncharacterized protein
MVLSLLEGQIIRYHEGLSFLTSTEQTLPEKHLRAVDFKKMLLGANIFFDREKERINALNVFPVPDGDTGTNMSMTLQSALEGSLEYEGESIGELSEIVAHKALMGARGNSGVILSQILRGIARGLQKKDAITPAELSKAFQYGVVYAYKAVSKPVEGTILTVAREMARGIRAAARKGESFYNSMEAAIASGKETLAKTTEMLPALKEAGVVDAGGLGLLVFLEGCLFSLKKSLNELVSHKEESSVAVQDHPQSLSQLGPELLNLDFPYCTEVIIRSARGAFGSLKEKLEPLGDSLLVAADQNLAKVHIHTAAPGLVLQTALTYGSLHDIKIENMLDQHHQAYSTVSPVEKAVLLPGVAGHQAGEVGIISVSFGEGFREIFLSLGADEIVFGGQTMNPNVEDLLRAVDKLPQEAVIILPNNKNIIMVAQQVKMLSSKTVEVLETRSLPEGLAALVAYNPSSSVVENKEAMLTGINRVTTGLVTHATRNTVIGGKSIETGHFLGLAGDEIVSAGDNLMQTTLDLADQIAGDQDDLITIFYGQGVSRQDASKLANLIGEKHSSIEIELQYGGQPLYYYIFSVE